MMQISESIQNLHKNEVERINGSKFNKRPSQIMGAQGLKKLEMKKDLRMKPSV